MDAVKFIEERKRMCESFSMSCKGCPAFGTDEDRLCCAVETESPLDATAQIAIVEAWSATHPRKTRQSEFLKMFPNPALDSDGIIAIQPCEVIVDACKDSNDNKRTNCWTCRREFWMEEVE